MRSLLVKVRRSSVQRLMDQQISKRSSGCPRSTRRLCVAWIPVGRLPGGRSALGRCARRRLGCCAGARGKERLTSDRDAHRFGSSLSADPSQLRLARSVESNSTAENLAGDRLQRVVGFRSLCSA